MSSPPRNPFSLAKRSIVVIGAGAGIGRAVALGCAEAGATVHCLDLDANLARATAEDIARHCDDRARASAGAVDVADSESVAEAFVQLTADGKQLHGVASTPGINVRKPLLDYKTEEFQKVVAVNLGGALNVLRSGGKALQAGGGGSMVLFSSIRSQTVEPGQGVYAATKAGIVQMVRTLAAELGTSGVRVNAVAPGVVETPLTAPIRQHAAWHRAYAEKNALKRWASPHEMAGPTVFLLSDAASYITGSLLFVDGGWTAIDGRFDPPGM